MTAKFYQNKDTFISLPHVSYIRTWEDCVDIHLMGSTSPVTIYNKNSIQKIEKTLCEYTSCFVHENLTIPLRNIKAIYKSKIGCEIEVQGTGNRVRLGNERVARTLLKSLESELS